MRRRVFAREPSRDMGDSDVRQLADRPGHLGRSAFDLIAAKLLRPLVRPGTVGRSALIERLVRDDAGPIVSVVAPAGYGKTTLLSEWAERNGQAFAWVSVDEADNDPKVLLTYIAHALDAVEPVGERVFDALVSRSASVPGSVVPRLGSAFSSMISPVALVLDDVHVLRNVECRAAVSVLAGYVPAGSRLVLAGRDEPPLRTARLRAEGKITEIGPGDLSLSPAEAASLLRNAGVALGGDEVAELHRRAEGWPAGLYLAALYLREGGSPGRAAASFGGDDRFVSEYVESEFLARISQPQREFLTQTAVLSRMCGPLCEAVLRQPGASTTLADLARSNMLLVPLDRRGQWYRYHHLSSDMLLAELHRETPGRMPVLRRRAAAWSQRNGLPEEALEYSMAAGDVEAAGRLVGTLMVPFYWQGRITTLHRWFRWLDERDGIERRPVVMVWAAAIAAILGRPAEAERWADAVDRWQYGVAARPADPLAEPSLVAMARGDWGRAEALAGQAEAALRRAGLEDALACAVQARVALHRGDVVSARQQLNSAQRARPSLTYARPYFAVQARIELIRVHVALGDLGGARSLMGEVDELLSRRPGLGTLVGEAKALRGQLSKRRGHIVPGASSLTAAELRVLPLLSTHLQHSEIAAELFLSPLTIKTHTKSIYRKLGASSRGQAVARARELGLLEG